MFLRDGGPKFPRWPAGMKSSASNWPVRRDGRPGPLIPSGYRRVPEFRASLGVGTASYCRAKCQKVAMPDTDIRSCASVGPTLVHQTERPLRVCAVVRRRFPVGASPIRASLQPETTGSQPRSWECPLSGVQRKSILDVWRSAFSHKQSWLTLQRVKVPLNAFGFVRMAICRP